MTTSEETKTQEQVAAAKDDTNNSSIISSTQNNEIQCHSLPCKIDFTGRAPVEVYFSPQLLSSDGNTENLEEEEKTEGGDASTSKDRMYSAHFRGRQLLATEPYQHTSSTTITASAAGDDSTRQAETTTATPEITKIQGRLLEIDARKARTSEGKILVKGQFSSILEWKHECEPTVVRSSAMDSVSRVRAALQWCDVAHALHDPIPVPAS